jgi:hypothetical protein
VDAPRARRARGRLNDAMACSPYLLAILIGADLTVQIGMLLVMRR